MKTILVNIEKQTVRINNESCNFFEAGLHDNRTPATAIIDRDEIEEILIDQYENEQIKVVFE